MFRNHASWSDRIVGIVNTLGIRPELVCEAVPVAVALDVAVVPEEAHPLVK